MSVLDIGFEWPVDDAGYAIVPLKKPKRPAGRRAAASTIIDDGEPSSRIKRRGGPLRMVRSLDHNTLFVDFAHLDGSDDSIIEFATRFGYLGMFPHENSEDGAGPDGESVNIWRDEIDRMRNNVAAWQSHPGPFIPTQEIVMANLNASLVPVDGRAVLRIRPHSLIGAIQLQFAQAVSTDAIIRACDFCGRWFEAGGKARRRDARFCSDICRTDFHNREKARRKQA